MVKEGCLSHSFLLTSYLDKMLLVDSISKGRALQPGIEAGALNEVAYWADGCPSKGCNTLPHHAELGNQTIGAESECGKHMMGDLFGPET